MQEINDLVAAVLDGQQKIWEAIERISKYLQELIQRDAGTDGEDEADPTLVTTNLDAAKLAPAETVSIGTSWSWLEGIPTEEESSVKHCVTSGLPSKWPVWAEKPRGLGGDQCYHG